MGGDREGESAHQPQDPPTSMLRSKTSWAAELLVNLSTYHYQWSFPLEIGKKFSEFKESNKSLKHELVQFRYPLGYLCLAGAVVASWSLTQEVAGSSNLFQDIIIFVTSSSSGSRGGRGGHGPPWPCENRS